MEEMKNENRTTETSASHGEHKIDLTNFDEGPAEIIRYMDWIEKDEDRMAALLMFTGLAMTL